MQSLFLCRIDQFLRRFRHKHREYSAHVWLSYVIYDRLETCSGCSQSASWDKRIENRVQGFIWIIL